MPASSSRGAPQLVVVRLVPGLTGRLQVQGIHDFSFVVPNPKTSHCRRFVVPYLFSKIRATGSSSSCHQRGPHPPVDGEGEVKVTPPRRTTGELAGSELRELGFRPCRLRAGHGRCFGTTRRHGMKYFGSCRQKTCTRGPCHA